MVCLNLVLKGTSLCIATRKPFNALVEGLKITESGERGIRTPGTGISPYNGLANRRLQPLGHLSRDLICRRIVPLACKCVKRDWNPAISEK
jgi:hypothetical protein